MVLPTQSAPPAQGEGELQDLVRYCRQSESHREKPEDQADQEPFTATSGLALSFSTFSMKSEDCKQYMKIYLLSCLVDSENPTATTGVAAISGTFFITLILRYRNPRPMATVAVPPSRRENTVSYVLFCSIHP